MHPFKDIPGMDPFLDIPGMHRSRIFQECKRSKIFQGVPAGRQDISFYIHPESEDKINDKRRPHRKKGDVDKPGPDPGSGNAHSFSNGCTNTKHLPFDKVLQSVHIANIKKNDKTV
jgi:hypothetical protein